MENFSITRYMPFGYFVSLLKNGLFIPKVSLFDDHWEGCIHYYDEYLQERTDVENFNAARQRLIDAGIPLHNTQKKPMMPPERIGDSKSTEWAKQWIYASCWHKDNEESQAMWKLYGKDKTSVAIETTLSELVNIYESYKTNNALECIAVLWEVRYILPGTWTSADVPAKVLYTDTTSQWHYNPAYVFTFEQLFLKHSAYSFEKEIRLVIGESLDTKKIDEQNKKTGLDLPINNKGDFLKAVYVSPGATKSFCETVKDVMQKYGFSGDVHRSSLDDIDAQQE